MIVSLQSSSQNKNFVNTRKIVPKNRLNFSHGTLFHMKTRVTLKYFVTDCL